MCCLDALPGAQTLLQPRGLTVVKAGNEGSQAAPATVNSASLLLHFRRRKLFLCVLMKQMILPLL